MSRAEPFIDDVFAIDYAIHTTKEEFLQYQDVYTEEQYEATVKELEYQTDNPNWIIRRAAAHFGFGLDVLIHDKKALVRQEAEQYLSKSMPMRNTSQVQHA